MVLKTGRLVTKSKSDKTEVVTLIQLTGDEIGIILQLIKNSSFSGNMIDQMYHLTGKLQKEYLKGKEKNKGE